MGETVRRISRAREKRRLRSMPRYTATTTSLFGDPSMRVLDGEAFVVMFEDIVERGLYDFRSASASPYIIDGGANIGVAIRQWKRLMPSAEIVAFEPDTAAASALRFNVQHLSGVGVVQAALGASDSQAGFFEEGSYAGRLARYPEEASATVEVRRLRPYLQRKVELLKLNVEGAETDILLDCADLLANVERLFVEYHSFAGEPQTLGTLVELLSGAGFRLYVRSVNQWWADRPYLQIPVHGGMDLQLFVYGLRTPG